jgi:hypothetical protein
VDQSTETEGAHHSLIGKEIPNGVLVFRVFGAFFFGAVDKLETALQRARQDPQVLILRMRKVLAMDATGLNALEDLHDKLRSRAHEKFLAFLQGRNQLRRRRKIRTFFGRPGCPAFAEYPAKACGGKVAPSSNGSLSRRVQLKLSRPSPFDSFGSTQSLDDAFNWRCPQPSQSACQLNTTAILSFRLISGGYQAPRRQSGSTGKKNHYSVSFSQMPKSTFTGGLNATHKNEC